MALKFIWVKASKVTKGNDNHDFDVVVHRAEEQFKELFKMLFTYLL